MKTYRIYVRAKEGTEHLGYFTEEAASPRAAVRNVKNCVRQLTGFHACDYRYEVETANE